MTLYSPIGMRFFIATFSVVSVLGRLRLMTCSSLRSVNHSIYVFGACSFREEIQSFFASLFFAWALFEGWVEAEGIFGLLG